jgi:hypothetical protein
VLVFPCTSHSSSVCLAMHCDGNTYKDTDKGLNVPKFDHGSTDGKGEKWRKWMTLFSSSFGQSYPLFVMHLNDVP